MAKKAGKKPAKRPAKAKARSAKRPAARKSAPKTASKGHWVYAFGGGQAEGRSDMKNLLGGKGANLAEMANLGLPVPPGFTITTDVCTYYYANKEQYPAALKA